MVVVRVWRLQLSVSAVWMEGAGNDELCTLFKPFCTSNTWNPVKNTDKHDTHTRNL